MKKQNFIVMLYSVFLGLITVMIVLVTTQHPYRKLLVNKA